MNNSGVYPLYKIGRTGLVGISSWPLSQVMLLIFVLFHIFSRPVDNPAAEHFKGFNFNVSWQSTKAITLIYLLMDQVCTPALYTNDLVVTNQGAILWNFPKSFTKPLLSHLYQARLALSLVICAQFICSAKLWMAFVGLHYTLQMYRVNRNPLALILTAFFIHVHISVVVPRRRRCCMRSSKEVKCNSDQTLTGLFGRFSDVLGNNFVVILKRFVVLWLLITSKI